MRPLILPSLARFRIKLDGVNIEKKDLYWNALMLDVVAKAAAKIKSSDKLKQLILVNYVEGEGPHDKGYRYIPEAKLSVQGQAANAAWKATDPHRHGYPHEYRIRVYVGE